MHSKLKSLPEVGRWLAETARGFRPQIALNLTIGVLHVACGLSIVWLTKLCIDRSIALAQGCATTRALIVCAVALIALTLTDVLLGYAIRWIRALLGIRSRNRLQAECYRRVLDADWLTMHSEHSGDMTSRLTQDVETVSDFLSERLPQLITTLLQLVGAFALLCYMDWRLAIVIIILTPVLLGVAQIYMRRMRRYKHETRECEADVQGFVQETLLHSLLIKALQRTDMVDHKLGDKHSLLESLTRRNTRYSANASLLVNLSFAIGYLVAFFWGICSMSTGAITFGAMVAFIQLVGQIQGPIRTLTNYVSVLIGVTTAGERLASLPRPLSPKGERGESHGDIVVSHLTFGYEDDKPVLNDWSATLPAGKITAIVGKTGIGKTTLVQLLLGILQPQKGSITPHRYAYVPQGNSLLSGTIRDNLLYGNPNATDEQMTHALRLADADFALSADSSNTSPSQGVGGSSVGGSSVGERGSGLSEGQAQRIGIARALLCEAEVLLLDEAFSALDSETAEKILRAIRADRPHQTIVFVTHREALIRMADEVVRLAPATPL